MKRSRRIPDLPGALKALWFGMVSVLLGPFALWFILDGKLRRRGLLPGYLNRFLVSASLFLAFQALLFAAPVHWAVLLAIYLAACAATTWAMLDPARARYFSLPGAAFVSGDPRNPYGESLLAACLALLPLVYILSLVQNIGDLGSFSIRLPSDVYTGGLLWTAYAFPGAALLAWFANRAGYRPGLRALIYFYAAVAVVLIWIMVWERLDQVLIDTFGIGDREPLLFGIDGEGRWRQAVKWLFYVSSFVLGVSYLVRSARTGAFIKRACLLGLPSLLLYAHMLLFLGDWNLYLGAFREGSFNTHRYGVYRLAVAAQLARTPGAYRSPFLREEWADLEYRSGRPERAKRLLARVAADGRSNAYHARLGARAEKALANLEKPHGPPLMLDLPAIKPASYLDREWYALLGAVAYLKPEWTDLDLRKRLLDLSSTVQLHLPDLENLPELAPAFRQLGIPISPCFLTKERAIKALEQGRIPFLSLHGHWVPLSGYDPGRDGFYYWSYRDARGAGGMFRNEDVDLFHHAPGERFGGRKPDGEPRYSLQKFIPADELVRHVIDIGGVAVVLGDSLFAGAAERRAAFLVEQGDVHYQDHENYEDAAACYREADGLFAHDQIKSRILYLKRRYGEVAADPRDYRNLFRRYPPDWMDGLGPRGGEEEALTARILEGRLGSYILMNWHVSPRPDTGARARASLDSAIALFGVLRTLEPHEPLYVDSLAGLYWRAGRLAAAESLYAKLAEMHPFGDEHTWFRLAWVRFKQGRTQGLDDLLDRCAGFAEEPRYLTMEGALALASGREGRAYASLSKSLKLDKALGETHALLAEYHRRRGDPAAEAVHRLWLKRST